MRLFAEPEGLPEAWIRVSALLPNIRPTNHCPITESRSRWPQRLVSPCSRPCIRISLEISIRVDFLEHASPGLSESGFRLQRPGVLDDLLACLRSL